MILGDIGEAAGDELVDQRAHLGNVLGGARLDRWPQGTERIDVFVELLLGDVSNLADRLVQRQARKIPRGAIVDLVVDVGDVADIGDVLGAIEMSAADRNNTSNTITGRALPMWAKS